jgi:hypothetical protein
MTEKCDVIASQRAWVGHGAMHDDSPPRRLVLPWGWPTPTWEGEPFEEETAAGDDWLFDDPAFGRTYRDGTDAFDSQDEQPPVVEGYLDPSGEGVGEWVKKVSS